MRLAILVAVVLVAACRPPGYGKEKPDAAEDSVDSGSGSVDAAIDTPASATCDHAFRLDGQATASSVWLTGTMVSWAGNPSAGAIAFVQGVDGAWTGTYAFPTGTHHYKFIVDGSNWMTDPTNPNTANDGMGNINRVYVCTP